MGPWIVAVIVLCMPSVALAQLPNGIDPDTYAAELRATIQAAPVSALRPQPVINQPLRDGWELGMVSWISADDQGLIYLIHRGEIDPVVVLDRDGRLIRSWGTGLFQLAHSIRIAPDGTVWTVDANTSVVRKFSPDGRELLMVSIGDIPENCPNAFCGTTDIAFLPDGGFLVADGYRNARIVEFTADGRRVREWGRAGTGPGEFNLPHSIVVDENRVVYVADRENGRIQRFSLTGEYIGEWPRYGKTFSLATAPGRVWLASQHLHEPNGSPGWLIQVDAATGRIVEYAPAETLHGLFVTSSGEVLSAPGTNGPDRFVPTPRY